LGEDDKKSQSIIQVIKEEGEESPRVEDSIHSVKTLEIDTYKLKKEVQDLKEFVSYLQKQIYLLNPKKEDDTKDDKSKDNIDLN